jgi:hypothetical protein
MSHIQLQLVIYQVQVVPTEIVKTLGNCFMQDNSLGKLLRNINPAPILNGSDLLNTPTFCKSSQVSPSNSKALPAGLSTNTGLSPGCPASLFIMPTSFLLMRLVKLF